MFISLSSSVGAVFDDNCNYSVKIYLDFFSRMSDYRELSDYQFPKYMEDNILFIQELRVINTGDCILISPIIHPKITFPSGNTREIICSGSGIRIKGNLSIGEEYIFRPNMIPYFYYTYSDSLGFNYSCGGIELNEEGKYNVVVDAQLSEIQNPGGFNSISRNIGRTDFIHGGMHTDSFKVYSEEYLITQKLAEYAFDLSKIAIIISIIVASLNMYFFMCQIKSTKEQEKNMDKRFGKLSESQNQILNENTKIVNQLTELNKHKPEKIQKDILEENKKTNTELIKLNKNLSKKTKSAKKK